MDLRAGSRKNQLLGETRMQKRIASGSKYVAVTYWGGALQIFEGGTLKAQQQLPQDVSALVRRR